MKLKIERKRFESGMYYYLVYEWFWFHWVRRSGLFAMTAEQKSEKNKKAGKTTSSQKWKCTVTGYISTPAGLSNYQRAKGIDTSKRVRIA